MTLTDRQKTWAGGVGSFLFQSLVFFSFMEVFGPVASALTLLLLNILIASQYERVTPLFVGVRWSTFVGVCYVALARHEFWFDHVFESFSRLQDFAHPVGLMEVLSRGSARDAVVTATTGSLIVLFYYFVTKWPEWTERWELLRRAPLSASLGLQTIFTTVVLYPTVLTVVLASFFAAVISPLLRRQVRLNHVVFLSLPALFSLGHNTTAFVTTLVAGCLFLYFVALERAMNPKSAGFSFFLGGAFLTLSLWLTNESVGRLLSANRVAGFYSLLCFLLVFAAIYALLFRGGAVMNWLRRVQLGLTPARVKNASWWAVRDLWVDREADVLAHRRYNWKEMKLTPGLLIFGPREWPAGSEGYAKATYPTFNVVPTALFLNFYSFMFVFDTVIQLAAGDAALTAVGSVLGFLLVVSVPLTVLTREFRGKRLRGSLSVGNTLFAFTTLLFFTAYGLQLAFF